MFPSRSSNRSKIKIVDRPTSGCEPAAVREIYYQSGTGLKANFYSASA